MAFLILTPGWTKCPKLAPSCSQMRFGMRLGSWVREETSGLFWLCHNLLCACGTSMFWASVSVSIQEGAKEPFISTYRKIIRQSYSLPYVQQQSHSEGSRQTGDIHLKAVPQARAPRRFLVRVLPSSGPLLLVKEFHPAESKNRGSRHNHSALNLVKYWALWFFFFKKSLISNCQRDSSESVQRAVTAPGISDGRIKGF